MAGDPTGTVTTVPRKISAIFIRCGGTNGNFSFTSAKFLTVTLALLVAFRHNTFFAAHIVPILTLDLNSKFASLYIKICIFSTGYDTAVLTVPLDNSPPKTSVIFCSSNRF